MKSQIAIEGVLLVLLAAHGWLLFQKSERWSSDLRAVMATRASDQGIVNNATAVDIEGRRIDFARILETRHVAIFLLHGATVTSD